MCLGIHVYACMHVCESVRMYDCVYYVCANAIDVYLCMHVVCLYVCMNYEGMYYVHVAYSFARIPGYTYIIMIVSKYIFSDLFTAE